MSDERAAALARRTEGYAAKFAAETVSYEPPSFPGASDANLAATFAHCTRVPKADEYPAIRDALARLWPLALVRVWRKDERWYAAVPLANPGKRQVPGDEVERLCGLAAEAIGLASRGQHGEVMPAGPTIAGGPGEVGWHITPALEPREYLFTDSPLPGLWPRDRQGNVIRTPLG
ncbi:hypothetical protein I0C86_41220 [Plantactinospora sp. S1510]|uniref:Uncharacterized protein n=1 Tax=Plantactinospora alkalitolerans TaxID=2789879 RepID=A0ABS0H9X0_9ACTN|nr:hypothetical protein [Plantactinospora alkalitolerans]MBF9135274.1 hypothetical protein [Plantactinospora alkalitolerans]